MRRRLRVQFDIDYPGTPGIKGDPVSQTIPDMNLTVRQLLENHTKVGEVSNKEPLYFDMEIPTLNDITDVEKFKEQLQNRLKSVNNFLDDEDQKKITKRDLAAAAAAAKSDLNVPPAKTIPDPAGTPLDS